MGAWATMIRDYSEGSSLKLAVADTFSGERPCEKCMQLTRNQTGSSNPSEITASSSVPPEVEFLAPLRLPPPPQGRNRFSIESFLNAKTLNLRPPTPPPRFFLS